MKKRSRIAVPSPLFQAYELTRKVSRLGFDWPQLEGVLRKMDEEVEELREALSLQDRNRVREEIGDLLFVVVNIARFLRIDPEKALEKTIKKFKSRFQYIERSLAKQGRSIRHSNLVEMERLWQESKRRK